MIRTALLFLFLTAFPALAASPVPTDFAWKSSLSFPSGGALYELNVPLSVYRVANSPVLADVCIFNGRGEVVPFSVTNPPQPPLQKRIILPHFHLPDKSVTGEQVSIHVHRSSGKIEMVSQGKADAPIAAYLIDASSLSEPITSLELEWSDIPEGVNERVSVEASDDLDHWRPVTTATLASLKRGDSRVEQKQISLSGLKTRYIRITQKGSRSVVVFTKVVAVLSAGSAEPARERLAVIVSPVPGKPGEYLFDISGNMPVDRLRVQLPDRNSLVRGIVSSRAKDGDPWVKRHEGVVYRIDTGDGELLSPELTIPASGDRYWSLKISEAGGGVGTAALGVDVAWVPHRLLFLPRGEAPFKLVFGSGRADTRNIRGTDLLTLLPATETDKTKIVRAEAGTAVTLGGEAAMKTEFSAVTRKKLLLWGVLFVGVAVLGWMALRLGRQMKLEDG